MLRNSEFRQQLHVVAPSPVRGQLEPQDQHIKPGYRYIQCTDTPDELKVLLPPRTAFMYGQLLKAELSALANRHFVDWNRLVEIRHLKDRMLRKCMRLSRAWIPSRRPKDELTFLTVPAPENFRLKELEKWIQNEESRITKDESKKNTSSDSRKTSMCCERCSRSGCHPHRATLSKSSRRSSHSTISSFVGHIHSVPMLVTTSPSSSQSTTYNDPDSPSEMAIIGVRGSPPSRADDIYGDEVPRELIHPPANFEQQTAPFIHKPPSPDPLPHPYRHRNSLEIPRIVITRATSECSETASFDASPAFEEYSPDATPAASGSKGYTASLPGTARHPGPLLRRKSSLKQPDSSTSSASQKAVAWAMDKDLVDQVSKRDIAVEEAEFADQEWEDICVTYLNQMSGLQALRQNISWSLERLRLETDRLQREEVAMREEEERLRMTYELLEQKQTEYRAKVKTALEESQIVVSLCTGKREAELEAS